MDGPEKHSLKQRHINVLAVGLFYFLLFALAVALNEHYRYFRFPLSSSDLSGTLFGDVVVGVVAGFGVVGITWVAARQSVRLRRLTREFKSMLGPLNETEVFFIAAFSALGEEFFFRGIVQAVVGLIPASLLFGLLHVGPGRKYIPWTVFAILVGFFFGWIYEWRGNLLVPTIGHFVVNYVNLRLIIRSQRDSESSSS